MEWHRFGESDVAKPTEIHGWSMPRCKLVMIAFVLVAPLMWWIMNQWMQQYTF